MSGRNGAELAELMLRFRAEGMISVPPEQLAWLSERFAAGRFDDDECLALIAERSRRDGILIDPHSAVGVGVAERLRRRDVPMICLGTAHPAKFPDAVERATGERPPLPEHLADLFERPERFDTMADDVDALKTYVRGHLTAHG